ncbi:MAG: site-specific DNA-methyltransferase [Clostridia bacterium]|nr:site-specific DNA-methyltransferase [Clostridia bacterium]
MNDSALIVTKKEDISKVSPKDNALFEMDVETLLDSLPEDPIFDLVVTSPPYDIGKSYEKKMPLEDYVAWQRRIIQKIYPRLKNNGSICWEVGNFISKDGSIVPLDIALDPIFRELNMYLRNRIVWHFGHGLHSKTRFSGRYEVIMWYTKSEDYVFNLDPVRIPAKYPGKRHFKGPHKGELSGNPLGKNPEDVWDDIPNVKSNHIEKTIHPCQFPVGLIERLVLSMTNEGGLVFDPFAGVASAGVAAIINNRSFWGCEIVDEYIQIGKDRLIQSIDGTIKYRENKPIYDPGRSNLSKRPEEWNDSEGNES